MRTDLNAIVALNPKTAFLNKMFGKSPSLNDMHQQMTAEANERGISLEALMAEKVSNQVSHRRAMRGRKIQQVTPLQ